MKSSPKIINVVGLISGTSVDGIDAALVEISGDAEDFSLELLAGATYPYPTELSEQIQGLCQNQPQTPEAIAALDDHIAYQFALTAHRIQQKAQVPAALIGSHGQTIFHAPPRRIDLTSPPSIASSPANSTVEAPSLLSHSTLGYSWQLGRGAAIAQLTQLPTVSNFRAADIAAGGQGAPLVSKVDAYLLSTADHHRCVQNLGGIGNLTYLPPRQIPGQISDWEAQIVGWDTGPANTLIDLAVQQLSEGQQTYDQDGAWAAQGQPCQALVEQWLTQPYFQQPPPKSTGRELFGPDYLHRCWQDYHQWLDQQGQSFQAADWLATLTELTAQSIVQSYQQFLPQMPDEVLLCGGGSHNLYLQQCLQRWLPAQTRLLTTGRVGLDQNFKEAIAFAVLAYWRYCWQFPGNLPSVTGATQPMLLGEITQL